MTVWTLLKLLFLLLVFFLVLFFKRKFALTHIHISQSTRRSSPYLPVAMVTQTPTHMHPELI